MPLALPFPLPQVVSIIGGGGKTTLLYLLGRALADSGASVLLTTTTHLGFPPPAGVPFLSPESPQALLAAAKKGSLLLAAFPAERGKLQGIPESWIPLCRQAFDHILIEADGSRNLPLKWHRAHEPCPAGETELLIQLSGLSALGQRADDVLHRRADSFLAADDLIEEKDIAALQLRAFAHAGFKGKTLSLLNQADTPEITARGMRIASMLAAEGRSAYTCSLQKNGLVFVGKDGAPC